MRSECISESAMKLTSARVFNSLNSSAFSPWGMFVDHAPIVSRITCEALFLSPMRAQGLG
jgi:hypothetical protein